MADLFLPPNSKIDRTAGVTKSVKRKLGPNNAIIKVYRWNPNDDKKNPRIDTFEICVSDQTTVLDALIEIQRGTDNSLAFRYSCKHGSCGSCGMSINGTNTLACLQRVKISHKQSISKILILPLPHSYVIRDLIVDLSVFYQQIASVKPWLIREVGEKSGHGVIKQSPEQQKKLIGLYDCVLCACCTTSCPSYWWSYNSGFLGAAALLQVYRWVSDSRDVAKESRIAELENPFSLYRCHLISNCTRACPKKLDPAKAISELKKELQSARDIDSV